MSAEELIRGTLAAARRTSWTIEPAANFFCPRPSLSTMKKVCKVCNPDLVCAVPRGGGLLSAAM